MDTDPLCDREPIHPKSHQSLHLVTFLATDMHDIGKKCMLKIVIVIIYMIPFTLFLDSDKKEELRNISPSQL